MAINLNIIYTHVIGARNTISNRMNEICKSNGDKTPPFITHSFNVPKPAHLRPRSSSFLVFII